MITRTTNNKKFREWLKDKAKTDKHIEAKLMIELDVSSSTMHKLKYVQSYVPNTHLRKLLANKTEMNEELLFPIATEEKAA